MPDLNQYPELIAAAERKLLENSQDLRVAQQTFDSLMAEIDLAIAQDPDLKNEAQRKAMKAQILTDPTSRSALDSVQAVQDRRAELQIQLNLLNNQFAVAKIEARDQIAQKMLAVEA